MHLRARPESTERRGQPLPPLALALAGVLLPACLAPRPDETVDMTEVGRMLDETAVAPVEGTVVEGEATPPAGDPTALARPEDVGRRPRQGEADEDAAPAPAEESVEEPVEGPPPLPPPPRESPYLRFGPRILVSDIAGTTIVTKPYPMPPGKASDMVDLMKVLHPFPFAVLGVDDVQGRADPPDPGIVEIVVLKEWDKEVYSDLRNYPPPQAGPINVGDLLVATAGYELLEEVEEFVNLFAAGVRQIEIEAKIIEVTDTKGLELGVKPVEGLPILDFPEGTFVDSFTWNFPNNVDPTEALLTLGTIQDQLAINAIIEALQTFDNVTIDQRPKVIVREGVPANLSSTQEVPFFTISSINPAGNFTSTLDFKSVGVEFYVAPRVVGTETLALDVVIEASQLIGNLTTFVTETGASLPTPLIAQRTAQTLVYLQPGQALVIGGLTSERKSKAKRQVPILGDIPLLGVLFRSKSEVLEKSYVLFVISPRIVQGYEYQADF